MVGRLHVWARTDGGCSVQRLHAHLAVGIRRIGFEPDDYHNNHDERRNHNDQSHDRNHHQPRYHHYRYTDYHLDSFSHW